MIPVPEIEKAHRPAIERAAFDRNWGLFLVLYPEKEGFVYLRRALHRAPALTRAHAREFFEASADRRKVINRYHPRLARELGLPFGDPVEYAQKYNLDLALTNYADGTGVLTPREDFWPRKEYVGYVKQRAVVVDRRGDEHHYDALDTATAAPGTIRAYEHVEFVPYHEGSYNKYVPRSAPVVWREYERYTPAVHDVETVWRDQLRGS